jgi:hypothetical protein
MTKPTGRPLGRPKTEEYETLSARVHLDLAERIRRYARLHRQSLSDVIREGFLLLLEEDRFSPFTSDMNGGDSFTSDRNGDAPRPAAPTDDMLSDRNGDAPALAVEAPLAYIVSDTKGDGAAPDAPEPVMLSDMKEDYDTSKYMLGELCVHGHDYQGRGQSLKRRSNGECRECLRARDRAYKDRKRARATGRG